MRGNMKMDGFALNVVAHAKMFPILFQWEVQNYGTKQQMETCVISLRGRLSITETCGGRDRQVVILTREAGLYW